METIKLNDNTELNVIAVNGNSIYFQNQTRDSLEFVFEKDAYTFNELDVLFSDKTKTVKITTFDDSGNVLGVFDDYVLRTSMDLKPVVVTAGTTETPEVTEERLSIKMAQLTYIEKRLAELSL